MTDHKNADETVQPEGYDFFIRFYYSEFMHDVYKRAREIYETGSMYFLPMAETIEPIIAPTTAEAT